MSLSNLTVRLTVSSVPFVLFKSKMFESRSAANRFGEEN